MKRLALPAIIALTAACGDGSIQQPPPPTPAPAPAPAANAIFEVTTINLTAAQPLSPIALAVHDDSFRAFMVGSPASPGLELLAEAGDNSGLLDEVEGRAEATGEAPIGPGGREAFTLELDSDDTTGAMLTVMTMLVNTNDAITGINGMDVSGMAVGDTLVINTIAYDSGTEANTEAAGTIPGPADGGEGFNEARDDVSDQVVMHGGVVTSDDGLAGSVLTQTHRFDNPVARIVIARTQ